MRRIAVVLLVVLGTTGCAQQLSGFGDTVTYYPAYDFGVNAHGVADSGRRYLLPTTAEVGSVHGEVDELETALGLLLDTAPSAGTGVTYWSGRCAPGMTVASVEVSEEVVEVVLSGDPPGRDCRLTPRRFEVQRQQLAWTVQHALDPLSTDSDGTPVRLTEADGDVWPVTTADPAFVESSG